MREEKEKIVLFAILLGEISLDMVRRIVPNDNARYKILSDLKKRGLYKILEDDLWGYRLNWHLASNDRYIQRVMEKYKEDISDSIPYRKKDSKSRMYIHNRNEIYRQIYQSKTIYLPSQKPKLGLKFPYTGNGAYLNRQEIREAAEQAPLYYNISELKRKKDDHGFYVDDVLSRNRSAGIIISQGEIYNVYSFITARSLNLKWQEKSDEPIYILLKALADGADVSTIFIGQDMHIAEEFLDKSEVRQKGEKRIYGVEIDNCGKGELYFIPRSIVLGTAGSKGDTRLLEFLVNTKFRREIDETVLKYLQAVRLESKYILGRTAEGNYIFNLMDFDLKKLRYALKTVHPVIYCFDWQEEFIRQQFSKYGKTVEIYSYGEKDIFDVMESNDSSSV